MARTRATSKKPARSRRKQGKKAPVDGPITLEYDLPSLPTAQHKAGLAGLLLIIEAMKRRELGPIPEVTNLSSLGYRITFTKESLQTVFDDLYDAVKVRTLAKSKRKAKPLAIEEVITVDEKTKREKREKRYVYEDANPRAGFLEALGLTGKEYWLKLWRETVLGTIRYRHTTRKAYEDRAEGKPAKNAGVAKIWPFLWKWSKARADGRLFAVKVSSSLMLGSQAHNAERVHFSDDCAQALLLHFWPVTMVSYVAQVIDNDGKLLFDSGYALAIPEVADLIGFIEDFVGMLSARENKVTGYRPTDALISIPQEGALEMAYQLVRRAQKRASSADYAASVSAIEVSYLLRKGDNVATLSHHRIEPDPDSLGDFEHIRRSYSNPLLRAQFIRNLLAGRAWFENFDRLAARLPAELFVWKSGGPWSAGQFARDARSKFRSVAADQQKGE